MNRTVGFSIGVIALTLSSLAYGVADSCDAFGYLSGAAGMESGDRFFHGTAKYDYFGQSVAMGDFDGDGAEDLLVGAPGADFAGSGSGAAYLFYGPISNGAKLNANTADVLFVGEGYNALAGSSVANAGDVDADGIDDILIGSVGGSGTPHPAGAAHLVLGGSMSGLVPLATGADAEFAGVATGDDFGSAVAGVGDVNGDGFADVAIGAPNQATAAGAGSGVTYVWYGPVGGLKAAASANFAAASAVSNAGVGTALAYVGDLNGDGYDDIVSGAPKSSAGGPSAGAAYLFLGGATLPATTTTASADASFVGDSYARAGASISAAGDQNGDGRDDFWVGAKQWGSLKKGAAYLLYGQPTLSGAYALESVFHAKLAGEDSNDLAGSSIAGNVDFDGDGTPDVLVGGERGDFGAVQSGAAWVVHGPFDGTINLGSADAKIGGAAYLDYAGHAVAAGDLNGDGFDDAMVGAWQAQNAAGGLARQGQVTSFFGGHDVEDLQTYYADADADGYGNAATGIPSCSAVAGRVLSDTDCNDASASYHPGATEACAGPDTNCDGFIGNIDHDGDGVTACGGDCDDGSAAIKPSADEVCGDSIDNDCDELIDDGTSVDAVVYSPDADGDGYGNTALTVRACQDPGTFLTSVVHVDGDCDDANTAIRPDASERCDLVDNNCDSLTDDASSIDAATWFADDDSDSYGNYWDSAKGCSQPPGYVANEADCDDADPNIKPGASEVCDFGDNDCDGVKYLGGPVSVSQNRAAVQGYGQSDDFGEAITFLGDQNGDGYDEIVIGAPRNDADGGDDRGAVFIQRGSSAGGDYDLAQPFADGAPRWNVRIRGVRNLGRVGSTLTHGDINGDGTDDLIIGANYAPVPGQQTGAVYVFFGPIADGDYDVNAASLILKGSATGDLFGSAIAAGDVDGDGLDDIIASAPGFGTNNNGRVYLVYGNAAMAGELFVNAVPGLAHFTGGASSDELGSGLSIVDLDADGYGDIVIGAGFVGGLDAGAVMVRYGQSTRFSGAVTPTATITGTSDRDKLGLSVANVHDVNNDGFDDLLVGSDNNTAYLFWGGGTRLASNTVNTAASFLFHGLTNQGAAESVAGAGDVDGDGYDDMIISAVRDDDGGSNAGGTYIVYGNTHAYFDAVDSAKIIDLGKTESFGRIAAGDLDNFPTYSASNLGGVEGAKITGLAASDLLGSSVAGGGDFNGDGRPDVAMGATQVDGLVANVGAAYVVVGGPYGTDDDAPVLSQTEYYWDSDADGYANEAGTTFTSCPMHAPISFANPADPKLRGIAVAAAPPLDDCNDTNSSVHPGAREYNGDGVDSDCDTFDSINREPNVYVSLSPSAVYTDTTLTAVVNATDPDGDVLTYTYSWFVNGAEVVGQTGDTLASTFFDKDDVILVSVLVNDGRQDWGPTTDDATVRNSKPTLSACSTTPATGGMQEDWTAAAVGLLDADPEDAGLLSTQVRWQKRFGPLWQDIPGETALTLQSCADRYQPGSIYNCIRGDQIRAVCRAYDSYEYGNEYASSTIIIGNAPPTVTQCTLAPAAPKTDQDIVATAAAQDLDADPVTFTYAWYVNGTLDGSITGATYPASNTSHYDVIQVRCTARDSQGDSSSPVTSTPVSVGNTPPTAPVIDLTPNAPRSDQDLTVAVTTPSTDIDNDTLVYDLYWTKDGSVFNNPTNPTQTATVGKAATTRGETWEVTAVANDGFSAGGSDSDFVVIQNTPPVVASASLQPTSPTTSSNVTVFGSGFYDDDNDPEAYLVQWYVNGTLQAAQTPNPLVLSNTAIVRGDAVYAKLTAKDPFTSGNTVTTSTITVVNEKPTAPVLAITPNPPGENDTLTCNITSPSTDADGDTITYAYAWYRNGSVVGGQTTNTFPAASTAFGEVYHCTVTPNDGTEAGDIGTSPTIAIQDLNAPPAPTIASIFRYNNTTSDTLTGTCTSGALDCNTVRITCNDGVTPDVYNTSCTANAFSQAVATDRGLTTSCSAVCLDSSLNSSSASNTVTKTACDPYDSYENSGTYGDLGTDPVAEWATLADNNAASITITANIVADDTVDWYKIVTSDNPVADAVAGADAFKFEVEMTAGDADYNIWVYKTNPAGTPYCVATGPYDNFSIDWADQGDAPNHTIAVNLNACTSNGSGVWAQYNECTNMGGDYFVRVLREFNTNCQHYQLRAYNGRP